MDIRKAECFNEPVAGPDDVFVEAPSNVEKIVDYLSAIDFAAGKQEMKGVPLPRYAFEDFE